MKVICKINNSRCLCKFNIVIYKGNDIVFSGYTDNYGVIYLKLCEGIYRFYVESLPTNKSICRNVYINECNCCIFNFDNDRFIRILLLDSNYPNLPIERGFIYLWQDHM